MTALLVLGLLGCTGGPVATPAPVISIEAREVKVGCGMCRFHIEGSSRCYWAVELEGGHWPITGVLPVGHENHAPDGMCNVDRRARLSGQLAHGAFNATTFELLPAEQVPQNPQFTPADIH